MCFSFVYKNDDEIERGNYWLFFIFSVFNKIMEFCVFDVIIVLYVFIENLISNGCIVKGIKWSCFWFI